MTDLLHTGQELGATLHERVRERLRAMINAGQYQPGDKLVQADVAKRLQVSITPVREAMRDLHGEGLIDFNPRRGATVRRVPPEEIREYRLIAEAIEPVIFRLIAEHITPEELERASKLQAYMEVETEIGDYVRLNREFHSVLYQAARAPRLASVLQGVRDSTDPIMAMHLSMGSDRFHTGLDEHRQILAALRDGDARRAGELAVAHWTGTLSRAEATAAAATVSTEPA